MVFMIKERALRVSSVEMVLVTKSDRSIPYNGITVASVFEGVVTEEEIARLTR